MKLARLVCSVFAVTVVTGWSTWSFACDKDKATAASAAHAAGVCTAEMAAQCTPEMAAACKAKMTATKAKGMETKAKGMRVTAAIQTADMKGMKVNAAAIQTADMRGMRVAAASAAGHDGCCASKASAASAKSAAGACATKGAAVTAANGSCASKGASKGASAAGQCSGHGLGAMAAVSGHDDCEACLDMSSCSEALDAVRAHRQAVRLKNGVMYVYTADTQRDVSAVQVAVARRGDHMARLVSAGDKARLCAECKSMRGAMASGKLTREIVNIEGGSLTLITSTDAAMVAKIHAMADAKVAARGPKS